MVFEAPHVIFKVARGEKVKLGQALVQQLTPEIAREHLKRLEKRREEVEQLMQEHIKRELKETKEMERFMERIERSKNRSL